MKDWMEILLRSASLFLLILAAVRIFGKRHPSRMTPFHFINYVVIAAITSLISSGLIANLALGLIPLGVWIAFPIALDYLSMKSKWVHDWVNGKETILIKQGKIMEENLGRVRLTAEELLRELRSKEVFNLADVEFALLETTGEVNVLLKSDRKPISPHHLGQKVAPRSEPQTVILDGNILDESLSNAGLNREWLKTQLNQRGVSPDNVLVGQIDSSGDLYLDLFDDSVRLPFPRVKEMIYANLQKNQANLETFALETKDEKAKTMYSENAQRLKTVIEKLEPYLLS